MNVSKNNKPALFSLAFLLFGAFVANAALPNLFISDGDQIDLFNGTSLNSSFISLGGASGVAVGVNGTLYAASADDAQVYSYNATTGVLTGTFVPFFGSSDPGSVQGPEGMAFGPDTNLYIADVTAGNVHVYSNTGASTGTLGGVSLVQPINVAFNHAGQLFAVDGNGIEEYSAGLGQFMSYIPAISGGGSYVLNNPGAVAFSSTGDAFVLDISGSSSSILKFTGNTFDSEIVNFDATNFAPSDLIIGPDGKLYVSGIDFDNSVGEVLAFNPDGSGESVYTSGLNAPTFITFAAPEPSSNVLVVCGLGLAAACLRRRSVVLSEG